MKRFKTTVAAALTAVALLGSLGFMAACGPEDAAEPAAQAYVSPYDWSGLERSGDRLAFRENGEVRSQLGVDVSDHQGAIDWSAVASDGVDFAFVRVGNRATPRARCTPIPDTPRTSTTRRAQAWTWARTSSRRPSASKRRAKKPSSCCGCWPAAIWRCPWRTTTSPSPTARAVRTT